MKERQSDRCGSRDDHHRSRWRNRRGLFVADRRSQPGAIVAGSLRATWNKITFGPLIQGAAWEIRAPHPPTHIGMLDGYLTVAFGVSHFHLCIGPHKGPPIDPAPEALAHHRRTARAELYRRLDKSGAPVSWGLRLFNGHREQQTTILLPNPFLAPDTDKILKTPGACLAVAGSLPRITRSTAS